MEIKFYDYQGKRNVINKTLDAPLITLNGELRSEFNRRNGVVDIKVSGFDSLVLRSNYCYITELDRYYFINDLTLLSLNIIRLDLICNLLMSFKNYLKDEELMIERQANNYNPFLRDDSAPLKTEKIVTENVVTHGQLVDTNLANNNIKGEDYSVILSLRRPSADVVTNTLIGDINNNVLSFPNLNGTEPGTLGPYTTRESTILSLCQQSAKPLLIKNASLEAILRYIYQDVNRVNYVQSIVVFPFKFETLGELHDKIIFGPELSDIVTADNYDFYPRFYTIADFTIPQASSYLDYAPFSQYELYIAYLGWITLDANDVVGKRLLVEFNISSADGGGNVFVIDATDNKLIYQSTIQLGVKLGLSASNQGDIERNKLSSLINLSLGTITSGINIAGGVATGNPFGVAKGIAGIGSSFGAFANTTIHNIFKAYGQVTSGINGLYSPKNVRLRITKNAFIDDMYTFTQNEGRLSLKKLKLSTLIGFSKCASDIHLNAYPSSTLQEMTLIKNQLIEGFYYSDN